MSITRDELAKLIDHTLLKTDASHAQVAELVEEAQALGTYSVCISPSMLPLEVATGDVKVATVVGFPSGNHTAVTKAREAAEASEHGADEIDMVIDRGAFLAGRYGEVYDEIVAVKDACRRPDGADAHLKVIMETGELKTYDNIRRASWLSILGGGDFIKTSTGKVSPAATLPVTLLMLEAVRDWHLLTGERIGVKPAGGIRSSKDAIKYLVTVAETAGEEWLVPELFRFGTSSLLNDVLLQRQKISSGRYSGGDYVTID